MLRTASASPRPAPDRARGVRPAVAAGDGRHIGGMQHDGRVELQQPHAQGGARRPTPRPARRRTGAACDHRAPAARPEPPARRWRVARAELLEAAGRPRRGIDDLRIPLTPGPGADDVPGREDRRAGELHESSPAPSVRCLSDEMPALPAVRPARPPAAISPAFSALPEPTASGRSNFSALGTSSESSTVVERSAGAGSFG